MSGPSEHPRLRLREVRFFERDIVFRMPFRFGVVTLTAAPQTYVRARVEIDGREIWGQSAELLAPKWFDKNLKLSNQDNFDQLRRSLACARDLYLEQEPAEAFALHAGLAGAQTAACAARGLNALIASFGMALIDRAILDALCRDAGVSLFRAVQTNLPGIDTRLTPELEGFDLARFLAGLSPAETIHARHTVGLVDPITAGDQRPGERLDDGLPETLEDCLAVYDNSHFKLKVGGDQAADIARLEAIAAVLDARGAPYRCTLDGNEQYAEVEAVIALWRAMSESPRLGRLVTSTLFVEQPISRAVALKKPVEALAALKPVEIDESDAELSSFLEARALGYAGVSSKSCKGFYRALFNRARCAHWNAEAGEDRCFMSAEDLTTQAGVCVQQDLALATLIGCDHVERNGHHYVNGMAAAPPDEQAAFLAAHGDLYHRQDGVVRLKIEQGAIRIASLQAPGYAAAVGPDWASLRPCSYEAGDA